MKNLIKTYSRVLLAVAIGAPVFAQEKTGLDVQFRARVGYGLESKDNLTRRTIGLGLELGYTTAIGRFAGEVGFQYKPGDQYAYDALSLMESQWTEGWPNEPYAYNAGDVRRTHLQGATFRATYEYALQNNLIARGGVQLFGARFRQEVVGMVQYILLGYALNTANLTTDAYAGAHTKGGEIAISPFIGFGYRFGAGTFELNVIGLSYKAIDYVHVAGTGTTIGSGYNNSKDRIEETSRMVPHVEIAYAFRF